MNLVRRAAQQVGAGMSLADFDRVLDMMFGGAPTYTGKTVSQSTALSVAMAWTCINYLSSDLAQMPLVTKRTVDNADEEFDGPVSQEDARDHYLWKLLLTDSNPEMTAFRFKQLMQTWVLLWGNAYAEVEINGRGQVTALWPWRPDRVKVWRTTDTGPYGPLRYTYTDHKQNKFTVPQERMLHLRGMSFDGVMGMSPIEYHKQTFGMSMAVQEHGARFFSEGARPLGVLQTSQKLSDPARNRLQKDWAKSHQGLDNAHRMAILEEGLTWQNTGSDMVDAQYIEVMQMTAQDIARIYGMPQHRVGLSEPGTNSGVEEMALEYVLYTLGPWAVNWEQEVGFSLLSPYEAQTISVKYDFSSLLRGDHESIGKLISILRQWGIANADECRHKFLGWNPIPGGLGKDYWQPSNMMPEGDGPGKSATPPNMQKVQKKTPAPGTPATPKSEDLHLHEHDHNVRPNGLAH